MERAKIEIEIIRKGNGSILINFDGFVVPIWDCPENNALLANLNVSLDFELKK